MPGSGSAGSPAPGRRPAGAHRRPGRARPLARTDRGAVTAELAVGMLSLVLVTGLLVWGLALAALQIRLIDAAGEGARASARGESVAAVRGVAAAAAPGVSGVDVRRGRRGGVDVTKVTVTARPTATFGALTVAPVTLRATATARVEQ